MKDKWMNVGYEVDELKPHVEPVENYNDPERIGENSPYLCFCSAEEIGHASADPDPAIWSLDFAGGVHCLGQECFVFLVMDAFLSVQYRELIMI